MEAGWIGIVDSAIAHGLEQSVGQSGCWLLAPARGDALRQRSGRLR